MRIFIHMGDSYPDEGPNAKRMKAFYDVFKSKGHDVCVIAPENPSVESKDVIGFKSVPLTTKSSFNRLMNQITIGMNSVKVAKKLGRADVVITTAPPALISVFGWKIARKAKAKLVYDVRDIWPDIAWEMGSFSRKSLYSKVFEWNRNFMLKRSDLVSAVSKGKVEKLKNYNPKAEVILISNGLDENFLNNSENKALVEQFNMDNEFCCVYIGNLGMAQGLKQLLYIADQSQKRQMPVKFLLFGSGVEENELKEYVAQHELDNVLFPGRLPNKEMYTILKHAGMSFISLVNENLTDSIPTKIYEALGVGCPVLLAATGESAELLKECDLGIAVPPNHEEQLWEAFVSMYERRFEYKEKQVKSRRVVLDKYSRQKIAMKMEEELVKRFQKK